MGGSVSLVTPICGTLVRFFARVPPNVLFEIATGGELFGTLVIFTVERLTRVKSLVSVESVSSVEGLVTAIFLTGIRFLPCVDSTVDLELVRRDKGPLTPIKVTLVAEFSFMDLQVGL